MLQIYNEIKEKKSRGRKNEIQASLMINASKSHNFSEISSLSLACHVFRRFDLSYLTHHRPLVWGDCSITR